MSKQTRGSWRPQQDFGSKAAFRLNLKRMVITGTLLAFVAVFAYIVFSPIFQPNTYLVYMTAAQKSPDAGEPIEFAFEDFHALTSIKACLKGKEPLLFTALEDPAGTIKQLDQLNQRKLKRNDRVMVIITAHNEVVEGVPYLKCSNYEPAARNDGRVEVKQVLEKIAENKCGTKLVVLDTSRAGWKPQTGDEGPSFTSHVSKLVNELQSDGLWVMTSSRDIEQSQVSPALRQSVFGYVLSQGLQGAANSDKNKTLGLDEIFQFVRDNVSAFVTSQTAGIASQTPELFHHDIARLRNSPPVLLDLSPLPQVESKPDISADAKAAQTQESGSMLQSVGDYMEGISGQFGIPSTKQIKSRLGMSSGDRNAQEEDAEAETETAAIVQPEYEILKSDFEAAGVMLASAWDFVDRLDADTEPTETSAIAEKTLKPSSVAPHLWTSIVEKLRWYDSLHRAGTMIDQKQVKAEVGLIVQDLELLAGKVPAGDLPDTIGGRIAGQAMSSPLAIEKATSMGEIQALAQRQSLTDEQKLVLASFDQVLSGSDPKLLAAWLEKLPAELSGCEEVVLARLLLAANVDWTLIKSALETARTAGRIKVDRLIGEGWAASQIESGDRSRWYGERLLQSQASEDWSTKAAQNLDAANAFYREAQSVLDAVHRAKSLRDRAIGRTRHYIRWLSDHDVESNALQSFSSLCLAIREMDRVLLNSPNAAPDSDSVVMEDLRSSYSNLQSEFQLVEGSLREALEKSGSGSAWRIKNLAATALIDSKARKTLLGDLDELGLASVSQFNFVHSKPTYPTTRTMLIEEDWKRIRHRINLESERAQLATSVSDITIETLLTPDSVEQIPDVDSNIAEILKSAGFDVAKLSSATTDEIVEITKQTSPLTGDAANQVRDAARRYYAKTFANRLSQFYADMPTAISDMVRQAKSTDDVAEKKLGFAKAAHDTRLLTNSKDFEQPSPNAQARISEWHSYAVWRSEHEQLACSDATAAQRESAVDRAAKFRAIANEMTEYPALPRPKQFELRVTADSEVSLQASDDAEVFVSLESDRSVDTPIWLLLQFDRSKIGVQPKQAKTTFNHEDDVIQQLTKATELEPLFDRERSHVAQYPYRPDALGLESGMVVPARANSQVRFAVREPGASGTTRLVVKAIGGGDYVRASSLIKLPGSQLFNLSLEDPAKNELLDRDAWRTFDGGVEIRPFPNRNQIVKLRLDDVSHKPSRIVVELFVPTEKPRLKSLPSGAIDTDLAETLLGKFGRRKLIARSKELLLRPDGSTHLELESVDLQSTPVADGQVAGMHIKFGVALLVITDLDRNQKTIQQLRFKLNRPTRYLDTSAGYDLESERLYVKVRAPNTASIPVDGIPVRLSFAEPIEFLGSPQLNLRVPQPPPGTPNLGKFVELYTRVPAIDRRTLTAYLEVDGYPRAFVYSIDCTETTENPASTQEKNRRAIRIVSPETGKPDARVKAEDYKGFVPVRVEVDAPVQSFITDDGMDFIEVGVDRGRDRSLSNEPEPPMRINSDRQMKLWFTSLDLDGTLHYRVDVSDFAISLPATGLVGKSFLMGNLVTGSQPVRSDEPQVEYIVDGEGPVVTVDKGHEIAWLGEELQFEFVAKDDLTGVASVEVGFDTARKGGFLGVEDPVKALPVNVDDSRWKANCKVPDNIATGRQRLWIRGIDKVGNVSERSVAIVLKKAATPVTPQGNPAGAAAPPPPPKTVKLMGQLKYGRTKVISAGEIELTLGKEKFRAKPTGPRNVFRIDGLKAGTYTVSAKGIARGNSVFHRGEVEIDPKDGPSKVMDFQLR